MKNKNIIAVMLAVLALVLSSIACQGGSSDKPSDTDVPVAEPNASEGNAPVDAGGEQVQPTEAPREVIQQWGVGASASSRFGDEDWSPIQAAGAPDTTECTDAPSAWASQMGSGEEWLEVYYETAVEPSDVNIYQTYGATQITKVELLDTQGNYHEIYSGEPSETECPFVMQIGITDWDYEAVAVNISFDESFLNYWNEIDAVELVGLSTGKVVATPAALFATATPFAAPAGTLWRLGSESSPSTSGLFSVPGGVDVTADGNVYVTDMVKGVFVFDKDGHQKNLIQTNEMSTIADVSVAPNGNVYVASWGNNSVLAYNSSGKLLWQFGEAGNGPGQFDDLGPQNLTVGPDENIYVLDNNKNSSDEEWLRVQVLSPDGKYLREFDITEEWFTADDMDFGPDGKLYIVSGFANIILVLNTDGSVDGRIGSEALKDSSLITGIDIDQQGNMYIATGHLEQGILKLNKYGEFVATFGVNIEDGERPWSEGGFYGANGIGVMPDGSAAFVTDWSGDYAYLTAFTFDK